MYRPTETGAAFIVLARYVLEVRDEVIDALGAIERGEIDSICCASSSLVDQELFRSLCSMHKNLLPSATVRPAHGDVPQLIEEVRAGAVDVALVTLPLQHPDLHVEELRRDELVACVRKDSPLAGKAAMVMGICRNIYACSTTHSGIRMHMIVCWSGSDLPAFRFASTREPRIRPRCMLWSKKDLVSRWSAKERLSMTS